MKLARAEGDGIAMMPSELRTQVLRSATLATLIRNITAAA